jgi:hypothetical protein
MRGTQHQYPGPAAAAAKREAATQARSRRKLAAAAVAGRQHPDGRPQTLLVYFNTDGSAAVPIYFTVTREEIEAELAKGLEP